MNARSLACCLVMASCLGATPCVAQDDGAGVAPVEAPWTHLFDGETLAHWTGGGDAWGVRDGELTVVKPGGGGWLRTEKMYRDFELKLDFFLPKGGNSGVGLRGSTVGDPAFTGMEIQIYDTYGQSAQVGSCGAVYNAIAPGRQAVNPPGQWNSYRIRLVGDTLDVWLNGAHIHAGEKLDRRGFFRAPDQPKPLRDRLTTGYIALQDHGHPIRFRDIRIRDLSPDPDAGGWAPIFNGRDLSGWTSHDLATWSVENGTIVGRNGPGHLFTDAEYTDVEFRAFVRVNARGNSGMYFRAKPNPQLSNPWPIGYEAQVDQHDPKNFTGCVYDRAWPEVDGPVTRDDAWFDYRVRAVGDEIRTWVNGRLMVTTTLTDFDRGRIGLQGHHPGNLIKYRDIQVRTVRD